MEKKIVRSLTDVLWYPLQWRKWLFNTLRRGRSLQSRTLSSVTALWCSEVVYPDTLQMMSLGGQTINKITLVVVYYLWTWPFILAKRSRSTCSFCSQVRSQSSTLLPGWWVLRNSKKRKWWGGLHSEIPSDLKFKTPQTPTEGGWKCTYHPSAAAIWEWTEFVLWGLWWKVQMGGNFSFPAVASLNLER